MDGDFALSAIDDIQVLDDFQMMCVNLKLDRNLLAMGFSYDIVALYRTKECIVHNKSVLLITGTYGIYQRISSWLTELGMSTDCIEPYLRILSEGENVWPWWLRTRYDVIMIIGADFCSLEFIKFVSEHCENINLFGTWDVNAFIPSKYPNPASKQILEKTFELRVERLLFNYSLPKSLWPIARRWMVNDPDDPDNPYYSKIFRKDSDRYYLARTIQCGTFEEQCSKVLTTINAMHLENVAITSYYPAQVESAKEYFGVHEIFPNAKIAFIPCEDMAGMLFENVFILDCNHTEEDIDIRKYYNSVMATTESLFVLYNNTIFDSLSDITSLQSNKQINESSDVSSF